jgi:hypothetical protein
MSTDDASKLQAALAQLEQERWRRIDQKVADGKAVYGDPIVVGRPESVARIANKVRRDAAGREIYPRPIVEKDGETSRIGVVITGVPRAGRDDGGAEEAPAAPKATKDDGNVRRASASSMLP